MNLRIKNLPRGTKHHAYRHGMKGTRIYAIWYGMRQRCQNPHNKRWSQYGGRGITVCDRWNDFVEFYKDMGASYYDSASIDRVDNDGNYCKENCQWIPFSQQAKNRRCNIMIEHDGIRDTLNGWSTRLGIRPATLHRRIRKCGMSIDEAFQKRNLSGGPDKKLKPYSLLPSR